MPTWVAVFLAVPALWSSTFRWLGLALLVAGYTAALSSGQLGLAAMIPIALLLIAAYAVSRSGKIYSRYIGHALFIALAVGLSMHWLPGFHNPRVIGPVRFTKDAVPFSMYLNLDKPLIGFWLLLVLPWVRSPHELRSSITAGIAGMLMTTAACFLIAVPLGLVAWEPKWPAGGWLWLLNNLLLVTFTEEALFRGYLQGGIRRLLKSRPYADLLALLGAATLFGLAHIVGGWQWAVLSGVAGVGYGVAFKFGGLRAAMIAHFGLNVIHFFLFTYPMLQPTGPL